MCRTEKRGENIEYLGALAYLGMVDATPRYPK